MITSSVLLALWKSLSFFKQVAISTAAIQKEHFFKSKVMSYSLSCTKEFLKTPVVSCSNDHCDKKFCYTKAI